MTTPILALQEIAEGVASQASLHNTALREFEARTVRVLSKSVITPPVSPLESDSYIIPIGSPIGWLGVANQIASFIGGAWVYYTPNEGVSVWVNDLDLSFTFNGTGWIEGGGSLLTTKGDVLTYSTSSVRLPVGTNNQVLTADSAQAAGIKWAAVSPLTTKGDVQTFSTLEARLAVGANDTVLTADSAQATGLKWAAASSAGIVKWGGVSTNSGNDYTISTTPATTVLTDGLTFIFRVNATNTLGNARLTVNSTLIKSIVRDNTGSLVPGDLLTDAVVTVTYSSAYDVFHIRLGSRTYGGRITNLGGSPVIAMPYAPTGWTVSRAAIGNTTITHNLSSASYSVVVSMTNGIAGVAYTATPAINSFQVFTVDMTGTPIDADYNFILTRNLT